MKYCIKKKQTWYTQRLEIRQGHDIKWSKPKKFHTVWGYLYSTLSFKCWSWIPGLCTCQVSSVPLSCIQPDSAQGLNCVTLIFPQQVGGGPLVHRFTSTCYCNELLFYFVIFSFSILGVSVSMKWYLIVPFICVSLIVSGTEHLFMCQLVHSFPELVPGYCWLQRMNWEVFLPLLHFKSIWEGLLIVNSSDVW